MISYKHIILISFFISFAFGANAQLSSGGFPLEIPVLKSRNMEPKVLHMPPFELDEKLLQQKLEPLEKSVKFAHSFEVKLSPDNSGEWFEANGFKVWQLRVKSEGALSMNLIFSKYYLPEGARLFVFDPDKEVILGAFTSKNNKPYKKLAVYPLPGDELVLQYEEPTDATFGAELEIGYINHDFLGVVPLKNRWKRRPSGSCNVDVQCETSSGLDDEKRAVCRIFAHDELGTATLLNNTASDGKPYLISAFHVYDSVEVAQVTLYDFNYESPFCTGIDGYDNQSISGAVAKASFDSLDFMLVELSETPPATFSPFYAGWDATTVPPSNTNTIHHPNGDTKKISHDQGTCDSTEFSRNFLKNGHWKVHNWETGTTEAGSSGAGLFNAQKRLVGTLTGGYASCDNLSFDVFARFDKMWDYKTDSSQQLKHWLDPLQLNLKQMDGFDFYAEKKFSCEIVSNFLIDDELTELEFVQNNMHFDEVAEQFNRYERVSLAGVAIGIKRAVRKSAFSELIIRIYTGDQLPVLAEKQYKFPMSAITANAMNYFDFGENIELSGTFYISVLPAFEGDSVFFFRSNARGLATYNTMLVKADEVWNKYETITDNRLGASMLMQANVCSAASIQHNDTLDKEKSLIHLYPNPTSKYVTVEFLEPLSQYSLSISDMTGRVLFAEDFSNRRYAEIDLSRFNPGIYLVTYLGEGKTDVRKIMLIGD